MWDYKSKLAILFLVAILITPAFSETYQNIGGLPPEYYKQGFFGSVFNLFNIVGLKLFAISTEGVVCQDTNTDLPARYISVDSAVDMEGKTHYDYQYVDKSIVLVLGSSVGCGKETVRQCSTDTIPVVGPEAKGASWGTTIPCSVGYYCVDQGLNYGESKQVGSLLSCVGCGGECAVSCPAGTHQEYRSSSSGDLCSGTLNLITQVYACVTTVSDYTISYGCKPAPPVTQTPTSTPIATATPTATPTATEITTPAIPNGTCFSLFSMFEIGSGCGATPTPPALEKAIAPASAPEGGGGGGRVIMPVAQPTKSPALVSPQVIQKAEPQKEGIVTSIGHTVSEVASSTGKIISSIATSGGQAVSSIATTIGQTISGIAKWLGSLVKGG